MWERPGSPGLFYAVRLRLFGMRLRFGQVLTRTNVPLARSARAESCVSACQTTEVCVARILQLCLPVVDSVEIAAEIYVAAAVGADEFMGG